MLYAFAVATILITLAGLISLFTLPIQDTSEQVLPEPAD